MKIIHGPWTELKKKADYIIDFHHTSPCTGCYYENMGKIYNNAFNAIKTAYEKGIKTILFTHGYSTSGPGKITARSVVRGLIRSKEATPYIKRSECLQHESILFVVIREKPERTAN